MGDGRMAFLAFAGFMVPLNFGYDILLSIYLHLWGVGAGSVGGKGSSRANNPGSIPRYAPLEIIGWRTFFRERPGGPPRLLALDVGTLYWSLLSHTPAPDLSTSLFFRFNDDDDGVWTIRRVVYVVLSVRAKSGPLPRRAMV
jgi:hypothetical protein